jgi:manganese-dependent ADP-ribose/CDP-alcohol diphosphatase
MADEAINEDETPNSPSIRSMFAAPDPEINQSPCDRNESIKPIISFGLITDIHYADNEDRWNYTKTHLRQYRNSLKLVDEACNYWLNGKHSISFILQLGDLIDGVCFTNQTSVNDLNTVLESFKKHFKSLPIYHIWGNHELYNFHRNDLFNGPLCSFDTKQTLPGHYGTFEVCPNLRIIAVDTYELSALGVEKESEVYIQSMELLGKHNQNENSNDPTGLRGHQRRFVQFNGGITPKQLDWLKLQLTEAKDGNEKVIVIGNSKCIFTKTVFHSDFFFWRGKDQFSGECDSHTAKMFAAIFREIKPPHQHAHLCHQSPLGLEMCGTKSF